MFRHIDYKVEQDVACITLNDPKTLNALSQAMGRELIEAISQAQGEARAILIGSVGRAFSSGANLAEGNFDLVDPERDIGAGLEAVFNPLIMTMRQSQLPIITAIRSAVAGVACGVACASDMIIMGESGFFLESFCRVGLTPDAGSTYLLPRAIGRVRAMEMMLLGDKLPANKALEWGLVNRVVADDEVDASAFAIALRVARGARSLGYIRSAVWASLDATLEEQLNHERAAQRTAGRTDDFIEGVDAFRQKRLPVFRGR